MIKKIVLNLIVISTILSTACTFPVQVIDPKENGVKSSIKIEYRDLISKDEEDNFYIIDNNQIKKLDNKGNISIIAGIKNPDVLPEDLNIDGDIKSAKFGKIEKIFYSKKSKSIYFADSLSNDTYKDTYFIREIKDGSVSSIYTSNEKINQLNKSIIYLNISNPKNLYIDKNDYIHSFITKDYKTYLVYNKIKDSQIQEIECSQVNNPYIVSNSISTDSQVLYLVFFTSNSRKLYLYINKEWKESYSVNYEYREDFDITLDKENNLLLFRPQKIYNIDGNDISNFYSPVLLFKIPEKDILNNKNIVLDDKKYLIGEISDFYSYSTVIDLSEDEKKLFILKDKKLYSVEIRK